MEIDLEIDRDEQVIARFEAGMRGASVASRNTKYVADVADAADVADVAASNEEWGEPEHLSEQVDAPPYPVDALPPLLMDAVVEVQKRVQAPVAMVACSALSTLSVAAQGLANVSRDVQLCGPISVYTMVVADSGERKTSCDQFFGSVLRDWESEQRKLDEPEVAASHTEFAAFEASKAGLLDAIRQSSKRGDSAGEDKGKHKLRNLSANHPKRFIPKRLTYVDVTPEQLAFSMATGWPSSGVLSAEAGSVFGAHGMGHDTILRNLSLLNTLWDGGEIAIDRRTKESFRVRGRRLSFGLMVQASALQDFLDRAGTLPRETGFLARFLVCRPTSTQGTRIYRSAPEITPALDRFSVRIRKLLNTPLSKDEEGCLTPVVVKLSRDAFGSWVRFHDDVERELGASGKFRDIRDVAAKAAENAARVAGLFHMLEHGPNGEISNDHMADACLVISWHLAESRHLLAELDAPKPIADAIKLDGFLRRWALANGKEKEGPKKGSYLIPLRSVRRVGPYSIRQDKDLKAAMAELEARRRARFESEGKKRYIAINPALMEIKP